MNGIRIHEEKSQKTIKRESRNDRWEERKNSTKTNPTNKEIMEAIMDLKADFDERTEH